MMARHFLTIGNKAQIQEALNGLCLKGNASPRIAMVGRSNVGKSSLINALLGTRLAQTSAAPGKTRLIHFYEWPKCGKIVTDLPGYGYAKAGWEDREGWAKLIGAYIDHDQGLERALVLLDARHGPTEKDEEAIRYLVSEEVPVTFVFTKADTLKNQSTRAKRLKEATAALKALGLSEIETFWVSAKERDVGLSKLERWLRDGERKQ